jgi:hypothetical protein
MHWNGYGGGDIRGASRDAEATPGSTSSWSDPHHRLYPCPIKNGALLDLRSKVVIL